MNSAEYTEFLSKNNSIQRIAFAINLSRENYSIDTVQNLSRNNDMANELLELSTILMYMKELNKYTSEWAEQEKANMKTIYKNITTGLTDIMEKIDLASMYKSISEDLDYIIGNKSMPHTRNVKRMRAFKLILDGKSYNEIVQSLS